MKKIKLTKGKFAIIDDEDFLWLDQYRWHADAGGNRKIFYARANGINESGKRCKIHMHRLIMNCPRGMFVDHLNGNGLDNRRSNLRICTHAENTKNQKSRGGKSQYRGVTAHGDKWRARITVNYKRIHLGLFEDEEDAYLAVLAAQEKYYV